MKKFLLLLIYIFLVNAVLAQSNLKIKGLVIDSSKSISLSKASVSVIKERDSILAQFVWTKNDGSFSIEKLLPGKYILLTSYPDYADYAEKFEISSQSSIKDFGIIHLSSKVKLLSEVIVKGQINGVRVKGDTLEYNSKSFYVEPHAKVEDLLRQIPGLQIDNNGKISAYGQTVTKVLIEGEEFFGDDPTLVTKNIRADMVDKIQLFDKKSDQAVFTGINDGIKTKTINLTLKEDKKKGYFGKITAANSLTKQQEQQTMLNIFKNKLKISLYGNFANTGKVELSNAENDKYGTSSLSHDIFQAGIITSLNDDNEFANENYSGQGLPDVRTGGAHYYQKWNSDKHKINVNYKFGQLNIMGKKDGVSKNNLDFSSVTNTSYQDFENETSRKKLDFSYEYRLDTSSLLNISFNGLTKKINSNQSISRSTSVENIGLLNMGDRLLTIEGEQQNFNINALYNRKFKKTRRTFSLQVSQYSSLSKNSSILNSITNYIYENKIDSIQKINQSRFYHQNSRIFSSSINYTEPISKNISLILNYATGINQNTLTREIYNQSSLKIYDIIDKRYSNDFDFNEVVNRLGSSVQYAKKNEELRVNFWLSKIDFTQLDKSTNHRYTKNFTIFSPSASYFVNIPNRGWFTASYRGYATQPTIDQLQPVQVYEDPTNFVIGNQALRNSFTNRFNFNYLISKPLAGSSINLNGFYYFTDQPIINDVNIDVAGKTTISFVNLISKNTHNFNVNAIYTKKIKKFDLNLSLEIMINSNLDYGVFNNDVVKQNYNTYSSSFNIYKINPKIFSVNFSFKPIYNKSYTSSNFILDNSGYGLQTNTYIVLFFPKKINFSTTINYNYQAKTQTFDQSFNLFLVNTSISKKLLKEENLKISISGNDLLNQNSGFSRSVIGGAINQSNYTTIKRYILFSLAWDFSKFGKTLK